MVTAGRPRVGVRMPRHPVARRLIELAGVPVAAPSANSFGRTSPTRAEFVLEDLDGRIDAVIDSGDTTLGLESTVVDVCEEPPILYRPGMVTFEQIQSLCHGLVAYRRAAGWRLRTPGFPRRRTEALLSPRTARSAGERGSGRVTAPRRRAAGRRRDGWHHVANRSRQ